MFLSLPLLSLFFLHANGAETLSIAPILRPANLSLKVPGPLGQFPPVSWIQD